MQDKSIGNTYLFINMCFVSELNLVGMILVCDVEMVGITWCFASNVIINDERLRIVCNDEDDEKNHEKERVIWRTARYQLSLWFENCLVVCVEPNLDDLWVLIGLAS